MLRVVIVLLFAVQGRCQQAQYFGQDGSVTNFLGDAKGMISSANTYIELTKKAAVEFNKTFHQLENALNIFQNKDVAVVNEYNQPSMKDCKCVCKCPQPSLVNVDPQTVEDMKNKILDLRTKLLNVMAANAEERRQEPKQELKGIVSYPGTNSIEQIKGLDSVTNLLLKFMVDILTTEKNTLTYITRLSPEESRYSPETRQKRSPESHCACSGGNDAQKTFDDLEGKADLVTAKIKNFNKKLYNFKKFVRKLLLKMHLLKSTHVNEEKDIVDKEV